MTKKIINFIFGRGQDRQTSKKGADARLGKHQIPTHGDRKAKEKEASEIISARFGRALERLGER